MKGIDRVTPRKSLNIFLLPLALIAPLIEGCSVAKVVTQPGPADLKGIGIGTSRMDMTLASWDPRGRLIPINMATRWICLSSSPGAHQASKARAIPYLAADVFTLGLAELILWPIEMTAFEATTCHGMATYNAQQKVIAWQATTKAGQSSVQDC